MNIATTAGLQLMPPGYGAGLAAWSRQNGLSGEPTWAGAPNAAIVPADQDFGNCLEILKQEDVTRIRFMGETPILPGTYLRVSARVKAIAGNLPSVRIAGWPGTIARVKVNGVTETGATVRLRGYGEIVEISAIVGVGNRPGVDMAWGPTAALGHFGLDLIGANGGAVRIENLRIEDATALFLPQMLGTVDVRDFGAVGDGSTDDRAAFLAADAAAGGAELLVPAGRFWLGADTAISAPVRFVGTVAMPRAARLSLLGRFDFPTYASAFGSETEGLKRAIQALFGSTDHVVLDLCGRRVDLTEPLMVAEFAPGLRSFSQRRSITNGQLGLVKGAAWNSSVVTASGVYDPDQPTRLAQVSAIGQIEVGARISGVGVGREIYVRAVDVATSTVTLSQALYGGAGTRSYTFTRDRYLLDFSGVGSISRLSLSDIEFRMEGVASGIMLPPDGILQQFRDCLFDAPKDRAITSIGLGCQGMLVDRCDFVSSEGGKLASERSSVAINVNANDTKIRNNRISRFGHFMVAGGAGHIISGNHWFQGDNGTGGPRFAGLVLANRNVQVTVTGNYVDNASIEWTNEYSAKPDFGVDPQYTFGGLTITGNTFLCSHVAPNFTFLVIKPYGTRHYVHGLTVMGNVFKCSVGRVTRVDRVDTSIADLDYSQMRNILFDGNTFTGIDHAVSNPASYSHDQGTEAAKWMVPVGATLPFAAQARRVASVVADSPITNGSGARVSDTPWTRPQEGVDRRSISLNWAQPVKGRVNVLVRMDQPY